MSYDTLRHTRTRVCLSVNVCTCVHVMRTSIECMGRHASLSICYIKAALRIPVTTAAATSWLLSTAASTVQHHVAYTPVIRWCVAHRGDTMTNIR